jgi:hypothetical protein
MDKHPARPAASTMTYTNRQHSFHMRFSIPHANSQIRTTHDEGDGGIVLVAASNTGEPVGLVLVADTEGLGQENPGASATNCIENIVGAYRETVAQVLGLPESQLVWAELDSMGNFDLVVPAGVASSCTCVQWSPLLVPGQPPRSLAAFLSKFPTLGSRVLARLEAVTRCDVSSCLAAAA